MRARTPNILYVTPHCPFGQSYGAQLRVLNIGRLLQRVGKVSLVIASPWDLEIDQKSIDLTLSEFNLKGIMQFVPINRRHLIDRIRHELDPSYINVYYSEAREFDRKDLLRMIDEHDIIWIHTIRVGNAFGIYRWPHSILDVDDIPSRIYASAAKFGSKIRRNLLDFRMSLIWRRRERLFRDRFDVITVCSEDDRRYLGEDYRVHVIPNGFTPLPQVIRSVPFAKPRIGFIGTLNWMPNLSGIEWFVRKVWPKVKREVPDAHLRLVGRESDRYIPQLGPDIEGLGWVEDPTKEIASWSAMIVPVKIGGGTRVKIAEAFARKCPVVSTAIGAFGYDVRNREDLILADNASDFASACVLLIKEPELASKISEKAWQKFIKKWTWDSFGDSVANAVEECLNRSCSMQGYTTYKPTLIK